MSRKIDHRVTQLVRQRGENNQSFIVNIFERVHRTMKQDNEVMKKSSIRVRKKREEKNARSMQNLKRRLEMARLNRLMFQPEQIPFLHHVLINQL